MYRIIFEWRPKEGCEQTFIDDWQAGSDIIQTYPGARGTKLFRSAKTPGAIYAIAEWESKAAREGAFREIEKRPNAEKVLRGYLPLITSERTVLCLELVAESMPPSP